MDNIEETNKEQINNPIMFLRLTNGDDVISEVTTVETETSLYYILSNPLKILYLTGMRPGILSISLMQWVFWKICDKQEFQIYPEDVMTIAEPSESLVGYYHNTVDHFNTAKNEIGGKTEFIMAEDDTEEVDGPTADMITDVREVMELLKDPEFKKKLN